MLSLGFFDPKLTLRELSERYNDMVNHLVENSHNNRCPKIDANYEDYEYRNVNPMTGNVFYYFFSANRLRRNLASMMVSAARYPNEKIKRAYLRFFDASRF